jgi:putative hemolysin
MTARGVLTFPAATASVPALSLTAGRYTVRFARTAEELDRILRLRYEIFNLELGEGLDGAHASGRDEDEFDRRFHHLLIVDRATGEIAGTYRMQTAEMAEAGGYYSGGIFEVEALPEEVRRSAVEIGRACVSRPHRNGRVLRLLWKGLASYLRWNRKTRLFGCCSLTSQEETLGEAVHRELLARGAVHPTLRVHPRPEHLCRFPTPDSRISGFRFPTPDPQIPGGRFPIPESRIPALFQSYLDLGAKALGPPAIDREFKTIDWLVLLDIHELAPLTFRSFFG